MTEALRPAGVDVNGGLHAPDLEQDRGIRISSIAAPWDEVVMHGYPLGQWREKRSALTEVTEAV